MTPGQHDNAQGNLRLADQALGAAGLLLGAGALEDAASRLYYAVFHAARAALLVQGRYARTHSGQINLFEATFGTTTILGTLFDLRLRADYGNEPLAATSEQLRAHLAQGTDFVERCRALVDEVAAAGPQEADPPPDL